MDYLLSVKNKGGRVKTAPESNERKFLRNLRSLMVKNIIQINALSIVLKYDHISWKNSPNATERWFTRKSQCKKNPFCWQGIWNNVQISQVLNQLFRIEWPRVGGVESSQWEIGKPESAKKFNVNALGVMFQQSKDPRHIPKSIKSWIQNNDITILE